MKSIRSREVEIQKVNDQYTFPCADGSLRHEGFSERPPPAAAFDARSDPWQVIVTKNEDPGDESSTGDQDRQEARHCSWSISGKYIFRNHVIPRTELCVRNDDFLVLVRYMDVCRQTKTSVDVLQDQSIGDRPSSDAWMGQATSPHSMEILLWRIRGL